MNKNNPKNKMEAFTHQFNDTLKLMMSLALLEDTVAYRQQLKLLKEQIHIFECQTGK